MIANLCCRTPPRLPCPQPQKGRSEEAGVSMGFAERDAPRERIMTERLAGIGGVTGRIERAAGW